MKGANGEASYQQREKQKRCENMLRNTSINIESLNIPHPVSFWMRMDKHPVEEMAGTICVFREGG